MKFKLLTHRPRGHVGISTRTHTLELPRELGVEVSRLFYNQGEGRVSVHDDTFKALTRKERAQITADPSPRSRRRRASSRRASSSSSA